MIYFPNNVYASAKLGSDVNIAAFTEIGHNVSIGDRTRIGAFTFIPEGVTIGNGVFVGPHVCFTNDRYPPSADKSSWEKTVVRDNAAIGAGCVILCVYAVYSSICSDVKETPRIRKQSLKFFPNVLLIINAV